MTNLESNRTQREARSGKLSQDVITHWILQGATENTSRKEGIFGVKEEQVKTNFYGNRTLRTSTEVQYPRPVESWLIYYCC